MKNKIARRMRLAVLSAGCAFSQQLAQPTNGAQQAAPSDDRAHQAADQNSEFINKTQRA